MDEFEDLLLSITEPIDKERNKPIKSKIETQHVDEQDLIWELTEEEEEKKFYQLMTSLFAPEKNMKRVRVKNVYYLDIVGKRYTIRRPYNEANWAIYDKGIFLVRIIMLKKNRYSFKVQQDAFSCLNLSDSLSEIIKNRMSLQGNYCGFVLDFSESVEILNDLNNMGKTRRNNLLK